MDESAARLLAGANGDPNIVQQRIREGAGWMLGAEFCLAQWRQASPGPLLPTLLPTCRLSSAACSRDALCICCSGLE